MARIIACGATERDDQDREQNEQTPPEKPEIGQDCDENENRRQNEPDA